MTLYIRGMVQDYGRAEDVTQEVFLSALRRIRETDCEIIVKPWLYEIAKNACIDAFRRTRNTNEVSFDAEEALRAEDQGRLADARPTPEVAVDAKLELDNLRGAFGGLSQTHHQILVLRELEGLSYRDIGDRLGMSRPAVESTLFRARKRLGVEYDELVSGKRCVRVRGIIDSDGRACGIRDQRRLDRHISHCQPCRRHALMAGIDLDVHRAGTSVASRIAALLPLPALWRRPGGEDVPAQVFGSHGQASVANWSASVASTVDTATLGGWGKAVVAAASVAVAGMGAGAAMHEREAVRDHPSHAPAVSSTGTSRASGDGDANVSSIRKGAMPSQRETSREARASTKTPGGSSAAVAAAGSGPDSDPGRPRRPAPGQGNPGSQGKPKPGGTGGSSVGAPGGPIGQTLDGKPGEVVSAVTATLDGLAGELDGALSGGDATAGQPGAGHGPASRLVQDITAPVTSAVDETLGGT